MSDRGDDKPRAPRLGRAPLASITEPSIQEATEPGTGSGAPKQVTGARLYFADQLAQGYFQRATQREAAGDHAGAIEDYTRALDRLPNHALAHYNRGVARHAVGDREGAIGDYARAIELEPAMADAFFNSALAHWDLRYLDVAARFGEVARRLYEQRGDARMAAEATTLVSQIIAEMAH